MDLKKAGSKKQGHCYSKSEEAAWPLLFLNKNDPVLFLFSGPYFGPDFTRVTNRPMFQNNNSRCRLTGQLCGGYPLHIFTNMSVCLPFTHD